MNDSLGRAIFFSSPDACIISDFVHNDINKKHLWQALDPETVRFAEIDAPYKSITMKIRMYPDAFDLVGDDASTHFILNAFNESCVLAVTRAMCLTPLGCSGFFTDNQDDVMANIHNAFLDLGSNPAYSALIGGRRWDCSGIEFTSTNRRINYINYPSEKDSADESFESMSTMLGRMFQEVSGPLGVHTRMCVSPYFENLDPDADDIVITLIMSAPGEYMNNGYVTLDVRKKR